MAYGDDFATGANATQPVTQAYDLRTPDIKGRVGKRKFIPQAVPGINNITPGQGKEWERKQRAREYRVAARREKRNRKADEKKQRKLNATILRRMTRNPEKYNKNAERNRLRAIQLERQSIWVAAVKQAERLAMENDPSGKMFNVSPVMRLEDGSIVSEDTLRRREEARVKRAAEREEAAKNAPQTENTPNNTATPNGVNPERFLQMEYAKNQRAPGISKTQQRKLEALKPKPPPPKPFIPDHISLPEGEENYIALWDLADEEIERRVLREKRRKAAERKALRVRQKTGKAERRMARDEKRKSYRELKDVWQKIKAEQNRMKIRMVALEEEERKKIALEVNEWERAQAMEVCRSHGFTLQNTDGVAEIQPSVRGMKGVEVDFDAIEPDPKNPSNIRLKEPTKVAKPTNPKRVDLGSISVNARSLLPAARSSKPETNSPPPTEDYVKLDISAHDHQHTELTYNHHTRRKLRRALEHTQIARETLVRERTIAHLQARHEPVPDILKTAYKPRSIKAPRILDTGALETAKQERVKARLDLTEFNAVMKVLRRQAKETAVLAGLRKYAQETGRISKPEMAPGKEGKERKYQEVQFNNGPARLLGDDYGLGGDGEGDGQGEEGSESDSMSD